MDIFKNMPTPTAPEPEVEARMADLSAYTVIGEEVTDRRTDKETFTSTGAAGSSAIYARDGGTLYLKKPEIHGWGEMTPEDLRNELGSKYGFCAAVLSNQKTSHVTLVDPKIVCHAASTANGAYAIFGGAIVIEGGSIDTNNRQGHGVDASYGGHVYCNGTRIHTGGQNSGALATDFQGVGIDTQAAAAAYLKKYGERQEALPQYMRALQLGDRLPSASEEKYLISWQEMGFSPEAVALAYDKTVLKCHELKWPYCNGILKRWHEAGLHTIEEIRAGDRPAARGQEQQVRSGDELRKYVQDLHRDRG